MLYVRVLSGAPLRLEKLDINHGPAWQCGDLWSLFLASREVDQNEKRERLPSAAAQARAREPILTEWRTAWDADPALIDRFWAEARAALPIMTDASYEAAFAGLE